MTTALIIGLALLVAPGLPASAASGGSYKDVTKGYSCKSQERADSQGNALHTCANITWRRANVEMDGPISVRLRNRTNNKQGLTCRWDESKSWTYSASVSTEIEAGVIFTKAKVSLSASVSRQKSVSVGTTADVTVSPHSVAWCKSGMAMPKFGGKVRTLKCAPTGYCDWTSTRTYNAKVPKQFVWDIVERPLKKK